MEIRKSFGKVMFFSDFITMHSLKTMRNDKHILNSIDLFVTFKKTG